MIAIDTNILIRLLTRDDPKQYSVSRKLFEKEEIFIPDTVILETEWVLRFAYDYSSAEICVSLKKLFGLPNVTLTNDLIVSQAITWYESGLDFADAFHLALSQELPALKTVDTKFIKRSKNISKCLVEKP
ncbi:MAG: type II toxin-antitoxin system VapC family toxin [Gammaproteobacteria bacterium]